MSPWGLPEAVSGGRTIGMVAILWLAAQFVIVPPPLAVAQSEEPVLVDRVVGVVDEDPILWSDMERVIQLGLIRRQEGEADEEYERRVFDELLDTRLRFHEVDRYGVQDLPLSDVEAQYQEIRRRFPNQASFEAQLAQLGLGPDQLRELLARQLMVLRFVEERLGPRVFVPLDEIQQYYDETLVPEMKRRGQSVPDIGEVREQIRAVLREERLNEEIDRWTAELRLRSDIVDNLERVDRELPPAVEPP